MISSEFKENVQSCDLITVRSTLVDYMIIDRTFKSFDEALEYASQSLNIMQKYDEEPFELDTEKWTESYLNRQKVALMVNFSSERIVHIKKVIEKVLSKSTDPVTMKHINPIKSSADGKRTGRSIISESPIQPQNSARTNNIQPKVRQIEQNSPSANHESGRKEAGSSSSSRTGKRVVKETTVQTKGTEEDSKADAGNIGTALIVGGVAVVALGVVIVEPIIIGTGIVLAGAGVGVKVKNVK